MPFGTKAGKLPDAARPTALHERIRADIEERILSGVWPPGHRIPFEHELMEQYGCARMTVNRALSALTAAGLIVRRRRAGSFVAAPRSERALMEIQDFAAEAARDGRPYRHEIRARSVAAVDVAAAEHFGIPAGAQALRLDCRHWIGDLPAAVEDRLILLDAVPQAGEESFVETPPGSWLLSRVPWTRAEHVIRAVNADAALARDLGIARGGACLVLERRTWQADAPVTAVRLSYPGDRHRFVGHFSPSGKAG
ncbi:histidine utilization repressor [Azospirillum sp. SYSU D00513]|uniref:histidine utilization repressor n=1 Tax=Azospirillum sp. SYSU D00513 TaxID=2812561 RepID=UPI001A96372B|nr:histidine utilization repressor [Azospirillum sp. SYSU D00513]